jgi:eukaryotic-like serine/threonine-protein kinase
MLFCMSEASVPAQSPEEPQNSAPGSQRPADWVTPPTVGEVITSEATRNSYTMGEKIGEGHFGLVYACVDVWKNSLAAKVMKPLGAYENVKAAAVSELNKLIFLRHPHITYVFDAFEYRETFYLITERCYCPLTNLFGLREFNGRLWVLPIARCLLQAVYYIHNNQYVHQDIHLGNVFAAFAKDEMGDGEPAAIQFKVGDLGVAKLFSEIDAKNTRAEWMLPPEVLDPSEFGPLDHRLDIYHCGLLFLHLALGNELRFTPEEVKEGKPRELALQLPPPLNFALEKALRRHVAARTENAMELWRDLNSLQPVVQPPPEQLQLEPIREAITAVDGAVEQESKGILADGESNG